jgi:hypothetical protein
MVRFLKLLAKTNVMKGSRKQENRQSKQGHVNTPRPEIRDGLDSRKEKEAGFSERSYDPIRKKKRK